MNTADYLLQASDGARVALLTAKDRYPYSDLRQAAARLAAELKAAGLAPGERVGLLGVNSLFWAAAYLALLKLELVAVPISTVLQPTELPSLLAFAECKAVCVERRQLRRYAVALGDLPQLTDELLETAGPAAWPAPRADFDPAADATLMFTSGTTAAPRAVRVTHRNIQANTDSIIQYLELTAEDRILSILPFYYCFGTSLLHTHLRVGGSLALCNTFTYPETALDLLEATECTGLAGVPSTYQTLLRNSTFTKRPLKTLRKIQQAGGKLPAVQIKELVAAVPRARVFVMYGQTEATARLSYLPPELLERKPGSIGRGIPGVTLTVVGETGEPIKPGEVGEIIARGDNISPGYLNNPEASAKKFVAGALQTGDLATVDEDGFIFVVDRKDDFIKSYGYRVSSQQIEACVLERPEVVAAAAVGEPDDEAGEAIIVYLTVSASATLEPETVLEHCRAQLARHMVPKAVIIVPQLPLSAQGKVLKAELRKLRVK